MSLTSKELATFTKLAKKDYLLADGLVQEEYNDSWDDNTLRMVHSAVGIGLVEHIISKTKVDPLTKDPIKQLKESSKVLSKQLKLLATDETINKNEYTYKLAYSVIQGVNQALHLYVITADVVDMELVSDSYNFLRTIDNVYEIAEQLKKFASAKQSWAGR